MQCKFKILSKLNRTYIHTYIYIIYIYMYVFFFFESRRKTRWPSLKETIAIGLLVTNWGNREREKEKGACHEIGTGNFVCYIQAVSAKLMDTPRISRQHVWICLEGLILFTEGLKTLNDFPVLRLHFWLVRREDETNARRFGGLGPAPG